MRLILLFFFAICLTFSQGKKSSDLEEFSELTLELNANTKIVISDEYRIEYEDDEDTEGIYFRVRGDHLIIKHEDNKKRSFLGLFNGNSEYRNRKVDLTIYLKSLSDLEVNGHGKVELHDIDEKSFSVEIKGDIRANLSGSAKDLIIKNYGPGDLNFEKINSDVLEVKNIGPGDIYLSGKSNSLDVSIIGPGDLAAFDLEVEELDSEIIGPGNVEVTVNETIYAKFVGPGDVIYKGNARVKKENGIGPGEVRRY